MLYFQQLLNQGGVVMYVIGVCMLLALLIFLGRLFHLHRAHIDVNEFIRGLYNVLRRNNVVEAVAICDETPGPVAHVVRAAILHADRGEEGMRRAVEEVSLTEVPRLERHMKMLATIGHIAPLLGLLGTVVGLLGVFDEMQGKGHFVETIQLAGHVKTALLTTGAGLVVAIVTCVFYNYLVSRIEALVLDMRKAASEMMYFLTTVEVNPAALPGERRDDEGEAGDAADQG